MKRHDSILIIASAGFLVYAFLLSFLGPVVSSLLTNKTLGSQGSIKAIGVGIYWDNNCTSAVGAFNWSMVEPGQVKNISCYLKNEGNHIITLSMQTSNWNPANATQYMTFTWDQEGKTLNPGDIVRATFSLNVSAYIQGITNFSFDITIIGSG